LKYTLSDHPLVRQNTLRHLIAIHVQSPGEIVVPVYKGKKGHPTLFSGDLLKDPDSGLNLRDILLNNSRLMYAVDVPHECVILDMDTNADYERLCGRIGQP
jgi:molybdenum cofactor cytidylyltransferase